MGSIFRQLSTEDLEQLAGALRSGRLAPPFTALALQRFVPVRCAMLAAQELERLSLCGFRPDQLAEMLALVAEDRHHRGAGNGGIDLVWSGPEPGGVASRDTAVVVRELFQNAHQSVMIAGYAVFRGQLIFQTLAQRMEESSFLHVKMFLDVKRSVGDSSSESEIVRRFASHFVERDWPGQRLPEVYCDPRSLETDPARRASLHAKCVVVDKEVSFVSSANFTEAAQLRNIEVGVLVRNRPFAARLIEHFEMLVAEGRLRPVPLG